MMTDFKLEVIQIKPTEFKNGIGKKLKQHEIDKLIKEVQNEGKNKKDN